MRIENGYAGALGAHYDGEGVHFAVFSEHAEAVELCLYDATGKHEIARAFLPGRTRDIWHGFVPGLEPGAVYGYRVHGPYQPDAGHRFNPQKLLIDPYARKLVGSFIWHRSHMGYAGNADEFSDERPADTQDNAAYTLKSVVTEPLQGGRISPLLSRPWQQSVIYETHVKGLTRLYPGLSRKLRGTFAGMAYSEVIQYIKSLGVTAVELLPVHAQLDEYFLVEKGLSNYWGYNTINYFSPHAAYAGHEDALASFRAMVDSYHDAGLEVILDVVYNHTAEGNHLGPTLSYRGLDNASYYQLLPEDRRRYINDSGCGNTLNVHHPRVMQMIMDSLRFWAGEMGVDGFRFDLATVLGREPNGFSSRSVFFEIIAQDPILSRCRMIAEPWDLGPGGYQLGSFPVGFSEWNDRYRDAIRRYWRGDTGQLPELARRLHGSEDVFDVRNRGSEASVNYIACHDGFTLRDWVSYRQRHNEANGEENRDGHKENLSVNHGVEGPTLNQSIDELRWRQQRNMLATLFMSHGLVMFLAGDEFGRTKSGNNNTYCQDNRLTWLDWEGREQQGLNLTAWVRVLALLRKLFPSLTHREMDSRVPSWSYEVGESHDPVHWIAPSGLPMKMHDWQDEQRRVLGYMVSEYCKGECVCRLLVLFNSGDAAEMFTLPVLSQGQWLTVLDSAEATIPREQRSSSEVVTLVPHSLQIHIAGTGFDCESFSAVLQPE